MWKGERQMYYSEGDALYLRTAGSLRAEELKRPADAQCDDEEAHYTMRPGWEQPRMDRKTGELRWACWVMADKVEDLSGDPDKPSHNRICAGELCVEDDFPYPTMLYKDHEYTPGEGWKHVATYVDCQDAEGCDVTTWGLDAPLAPAETPIAGAVTKAMLERFHSDRAANSCDTLPAELLEEPTLAALLKTGEHFSSSVGASKGYAGCPLDDAGFAFWVRYWPDETMPSQVVLGPVVLCDAACMRRKVIDLPQSGHLRVQTAETRLVAGPNASGATILLDGKSLAEVKQWQPNQTVLVLPDDVPPPLGLTP
jgi:hypothetical protein